MIKLYKFHPNADKKLDDIWLRGYQRWGEQQADKYIDGLYELLDINCQQSCLSDNQIYT